LLPPPFTYRGSVLLGRQLRTLCLETELEKRKKKSGVSMSVSVPLDSEDWVEDRQIGFQYVHCVYLYIWVVVLFWERMLV